MEELSRSEEHRQKIKEYQIQIALVQEETAKLKKEYELDTQRRELKDRIHDRRILNRDDFEQLLNSCAFPHLDLKEYIENEHSGNERSGARRIDYNDNVIAKYTTQPFLNDFRRPHLIAAHSEPSVKLWQPNLEAVRRLLQENSSVGT